MFKQSLIYLILSILVVFFAQYAHLVLVYIIMAYTFISIKLTPLFSSTSAGIMIRNVLTLTVLPVLIAGIPALIYRAMKGKTMPYFFEITWVLWLIIVLGKVLIQ